MSGKETQWIIESIGKNRGHANEVIGKHLLTIGRLDGNEMEFWDSDGARHLGYLVDYSVITYLNGSQDFLQIKFNVFSKEGGGKWRRNELHERKKKKPAIKKATEFQQTKTNPGGNS